MIALAVNALSEKIKGLVIFVSLLPMIVTPVIGALSIRWLFIGDGILTERHSNGGGGYDVALFAQGWTIELMLIVLWRLACCAIRVCCVLCRAADRQWTRLNQLSLTVPHGLNGCGLW